MSGRHSSVCRLLCTFLNQILDDIFDIISLNFEALRKGFPTFNFLGQVYPLAFFRFQVGYMLSLQRINSVNSFEKASLRL